MIEQILVFQAGWSEDGTPIYTDGNKLFVNIGNKLVDYDGKIDKLCAGVKLDESI